ncbi:ATP-binding protein [Nonomuraea recticatena]|uniref:ATP-binding protein n=1 Tax=Nonomuraea recticatena TaxID=46178 RepID=UPI00360BAC46
MTSHNLPAEPNRFVGRARDVDELRGLLRDQRLVTLCGVGGIGKTRLALRVAGSVVGEFPDGVWLVELGRITSPDLVAHEIATVLGVREERSRPALDGLRVRLRGARALLLLDNCEQVVERCAELVAELLAGCPDLRILLTTREALRIPGELVWRVPRSTCPTRATPTPRPCCCSPTGPWPRAPAWPPATSTTSPGSAWRSTGSRSRSNWPRPARGC